jgi:hypothetical protein
MATSRTITDAQIIQRLQAHTKMCVAKYKQANEELTAARDNQHILIELLADTMKRLREAEAALEEEKKKHSPLVSLLHRSDPWRTDLWESGARACEALLAGARPPEARACEAQPWEARACGLGPSTKELPVEGAAAAAAAAGSSTTEDENLYA